MAFRFGGRGSFVGLQSPGYQLIMAKADEAANHLAELRLRNADREQAERILGGVRQQLESRIWKLVPYPKYDYAWALLRQLRHFFCRHTPLERLLSVVIEDLSGDLGYLAKEDGKAAREELKDLRQMLLTLLRAERRERRRAGGRSEREKELRARLEALSKRTALAREGHWLKVNMTRNRLFLMGLALFALLIATLVLLPRVIAGGEDEPGALFYWLVAFAGGLGGLIGALIGAEPLNTRASTFYIRRRLLYLRPVVGGTLGLIAYLALRSGAIAFPALDAETSPLFALVVAFAAGFSERLFVRRLLTLALPRESGEAEESADRGRGTSEGVAPAA